MRASSFPLFSDGRVDQQLLGEFEQRFISNPVRDDNTECFETIGSMLSTPYDYIQTYATDAAERKMFIEIGLHGINLSHTHSHTLSLLLSPLSCLCHKQVHKKTTTK